MRARKQSDAEHTTRWWCKILSINDSPDPGRSSTSNGVFHAIPHNYTINELDFDLEPTTTHMHPSKNWPWGGESRFPFPYAVIPKSSFNSIERTPRQISYACHLVLTPFLESTNTPVFSQIPGTAMYVLENKTFAANVPERCGNITDTNPNL